MTDKFDVLVIGAGAAGLYTALCLPEHLQVGLINKNTLPVSASDWAEEGLLRRSPLKILQRCTLRIHWLQEPVFAIWRR